MLLRVLNPLIYLPIILSQYTIFQFNHYELKKYFLYKTKKKIFVQFTTALVLGISLFFNLKLVCFLFLFIINFFLFMEKGKIKVTGRIKRFICIYMITTISVFLLPFDLIDIMLIFNTFLIPYIIIIHLFSLTIENIIMSYYLKQANEIIRGKKVIGITGSYGKTSCKNIIYDLLKDSCNISKTPKSYNTKVGIIKSIREEVNNFDDYFICEYGVDCKGGMDKLLKVVKPNIVLISEIGPQHLLTFKNIDNIVEEKMKLAKSLKENEIVIINNDNEYLIDKKKDLQCKVITYGIENESDVMAKNLKINNKGSTFDLYVHNEYISSITISLLARHNVVNFLGAVGVMIAMEKSLENINIISKKITPTEHRLELKNIQGIKVIDDSFNSNIKGFKEAVNTLSLMKGNRIIITPGIIEQGDNSYEMNFELGEYMANKVDEVVLVENNADILKEGLLNKGFNKEKIIIKKDFKEAWSYVKSIKEEKIVLIENDLPSIYLK